MKSRTNYAPSEQDNIEETLLDLNDGEILEEETLLNFEEGEIFEETNTSNIQTNKRKIEVNPQNYSTNKRRKEEDSDSRSKRNKNPVGLLIKFYTKAKLKKNCISSDDEQKQALEEIQKIYDESEEFKDRGFKGQTVSNLILGMAYYGFKEHNINNTNWYPQLFTLIRNKSNLFKPQEIANILWALSKMDVLWDNLDQDVKENLFTSIKTNAPRFNSQDISNVVWALSKMLISWESLDSELKNTLMRSIGENVGRFYAQDTANTIWALATLGISWKDLNENLKSKLIHAIKHEADHFKTQEIFNTIWALAMMKAPEKEFAIIFESLRGSLYSKIKNTENQKLGSDFKGIILKFKQVQFIYKFTLDQNIQRTIDKIAESVLKDVKTPEFQNIFVQFLRINLSQYQYTVDAIIENIAIASILANNQKIIEFDNLYDAKKNYIEIFKNQVLNKLGYAVLRVSCKDHYWTEENKRNIEYFLANNLQGAYTLSEISKLRNKNQPSIDPKTNPESNDGMRSFGMFAAVPISQNQNKKLSTMLLNMAEACKEIIQGAEIHCHTYHEVTQSLYEKALAYDESNQHIKNQLQKFQDTHQDKLLEGHDVEQTNQRIENYQNSIQNEGAPNYFERTYKKVIASLKDKTDFISAVQAIYNSEYKHEMPYHPM